MLYPQINRYRTHLPCAAFWKFRTDPGDNGEKEGWQYGFASETEIAVPGSWNEQLEEIGLANYVGAAWYCSAEFVPKEWEQQRIWIRFGSADHDATVWVNGALAGRHQGGFLPFEFEITSAVLFGARNTVTVRVSNRLSAESIPQGTCSEDFARDGRLREETYPPVRFDFFPYGGIHRPVVIHATPRSCIQAVSVDTRITSATSGEARVRVRVLAEKTMKVRCAIDAVPTHGEGEVDSGRGSAAEISLVIPRCRFWSNADPHLYPLRVQLLDGETAVDEYELNIGVREVSVAGGKLLLNGKPVYLKGFGCHEDFPVLGKALSSALVVKDFGLMKWVNANSFRTSHYPYAEDVMAMADRQGFLVIDEVPAVSLDLRYANDGTLAAHKQAISDLIERDYSHPSVIIWALGNEPNLIGEDGYRNGSGFAYWEKIFAYARSLDSSRPMTVPNCERAGVNDPVFHFSDILAINRYYGWYEFPGRIGYGVSALEREMDTLHQKYGKPLLMTEFGADTIPGLHATSDQMFTEEYQEEFLEQYIKLLRSKAYVVGEHVWNFADFRAPQHFRRVVLNMKGVFTRTRQPKAAAFTLRRLWASSLPAK